MAQGQQLELFTGHAPRLVQLGKADEITPSNRGRSLFDPHRVDFVPWGEDNLLPDAFLGYYGRSPIYQAVIDENTRLIQGQAIEWEGPQAARAQAMLETIEDGYSLVDKMSMNLAMYNAVALKVNFLPNQDGVNRVYCVPIQNLRAAHAEFEVDSYYYCKDWSAITSLGKVAGRIRGERRSEYLPVKFEVLRLNEGVRQIPEGLIVEQITAPGGSYYPNPSGYSCRNHLELSYYNLKVQLNLVKNGMQQQVMFTIPFTDSPNTSEVRQAQDKIIADIQRNFEGAVNAGKAIVQFVDPRNLEKGVMPKIENVNTDMADKKYLENNRLVEEAVRTGLGVVAPELYGIATAAGFSSESDKLRTAFALQLRRIEPQQHILERALTRLALAHGFNAQASVVRHEWDFLEMDTTAEVLDDNETNTEDGDIDTTDN